MSNLTIKRFNQQDPRLGRNQVHDERSRGFVAARPTVDRSTWHDHSIRIYDPLPNPNQTVGNCTMCAKAMQHNAVGNRQKGVILDMAWAMRTYEWETANDQFPGAYKPGDPNSQDTGSSGLASCKTAQHEGTGGEYRWEFEGADGVVQNIMAGRVISVGTRWDWNMFEQDSRGLIQLGGGEAGGHQYIYRGYDLDRDELIGRCWWGVFRDFRISRANADELLRDGGDAHYQERLLK